MNTYVIFLVLVTVVVWAQADGYDDTGLSCAGKPINLIIFSEAAKNCTAKWEGSDAMNKETQIELCWLITLGILGQNGLDLNSEKFIEIMTNYVEGSRIGNDIGEKVVKDCFTDEYTNNFIPEDSETYVPFMECVGIGIQEGCRYPMP